MTKPWASLLVLISGAPGSGKTTLGALVAGELRIPHIDRDFVANGLRLTARLGGPDSLPQRAPATTWGALEHLAAAGVSAVTSGTMYRGEMEQSVRRLRDFATVVNVHLHAANATERWISARRSDGVPEDVIQDHLDTRIKPLGDRIVAPIDCGCERIDVCTDEGYDPPVDAIIEAVLKAAAP